MKPDKEISVLLPVFNGDKYISEAVDSILNQTFHDFEFIIINDGSTDHTSDILKIYESQDDRIRLISRENKGLIASLNEGIHIASGKWLARMDADDIAMPNRLERQLYCIEQSRADVAGTWVKYFGMGNPIIWRGYQSDPAIKAELLFKCPFVHPSIMMRTSLAKKLKYDPASEKAEDYDLWVRAALHGSKMINIPEVLLQYRRHTSQVSIMSSHKQQLMSEMARKKYWETKLTSSSSATWEAFQLTSFSPASVNFDQADSVFKEILERSESEGRRVVLDNVARCYMKVSYTRPDVGRRWLGMSKEYGSGSAIRIWLLIQMSRYLRVHRQSRLFAFLKTLRSFLTR